MKFSQGDKNSDLFQFTLENTNTGFLPVSPFISCNYSLKIDFMFKNIWEFYTWTLYLQYPTLSPHSTLSHVSPLWFLSKSWPLLRLLQYRKTDKRQTDLLTVAQSIWGSWYVYVFRAENLRFDAFTWNRVNGSSHSQVKFQPESRYLKRSVPVKPMGTMQFSVSCKNPSASIKQISTDNT